MNTTVTNTVKSCFNFLYDDKLGIINQIIEAEGLLIQPFFHYYVAKKGTQRTLCSGSGSSQDKNVALSKAIGECIERYCLSFYQHKNFVYTTCDNSSNRYKCIPPELVKIYTTEELKNFHFQSYTSSFSTFFCVGFNVSSGNHQYIPLSLVYLKSHFWKNHSNSLNIIQQTISTGAAFGDNFYQTALSGIYETIERDAMMSFWLLGKQAVSIDINTLSKPQKEIIKNLNYNDIKFYLLDISIENDVFVILTCIHSDNGKLPSMVFSAAAHHSIDEAIQKSIEESIGTFEMACVLRNKKPSFDTNLLFEKNWDSLITDRDDHVLFWSYKEIFEKFSSRLDFIFSSKKKRADLL